MAERESRRNYSWLVCQDPDTHKPFLIAGGNSEEDCRQKGLELLGGIDFEIKGLPTRNLSKASSLLKGNRLEETHSLHKASEKLGHEKSLLRLHNRLRRRNT